MSQVAQESECSSPCSLNLPELLARVDNDRDLLCELIGIFKQELPRLVESLKESVQRQEMKNLVATSHTLKGMLLGLSATRAATIAASLEQMAREGETAQLSDAVTVLVRDLGDLIPELDAYAAMGTL